MKTTKWISALLAATVLTAAAVPMASAEAANVNVGVLEDYLSEQDPETVSASFGADGAVTLTLKEGNAGNRLTMWTHVEDPFVNLAETPYLCWEVTGTANFGFAIRWDRNEGNEDTCYRMHTLRGHENDGVAPESNSINFLELLKNDDNFAYEGDEITMIATVLNIFGNPGDSVTIKLYFSANPVDQQATGGEQGGNNQPAPTDADDNHTDNTTAAPAGTTKKANPSTGESTQAVAATLVLAAAALGAVIVSKKKAQ